MKTRYWILLLGLILLICLGLSIPMVFPGEDAQFAEIISNGQVISIVSLHKDTEFTVPAPNGGENTITVAGGKIGVTAATCPDHYCMDRGMCSSGVQIVCLPNRLVIRFAGKQNIDTISG